MTTRRLSAAALLLALAACGRGDRASGSEGDVGGTVVISTAAEPDFLLPPIILSAMGKMVSDQLFERLAEIGPKMNAMGDEGFEPRLARHWTWAPDSLSIGFELDPRAHWHDGKPVRAADVKMGFDLMRDPKVASPQAPNVAEIDSVTVRDSLTAVAWYHRRSLDQFFTAAYNVIPVPAHLLGSVDRANLKADPFVRNPVGSGPFRFVRWVPSQLVELVADTTYFRGRPKLDRVVVSIAPDPNTAVTRLLAGEADFIEVLRGEQLAQAQKDPKLQVKQYGGVDYAFLQFNLRDPKHHGRPHPVLGDRNVRVALAMALDRAAIARNVYDTLATVPFGPAPRSLGIADSTIRQIPYDSARAKRMLDSLGWRDSNGDGIREKNGVPLRFSVMVPGSSRPRQRVAVLIQEQLKGVGADVTIDQLDFNAMIAKLGTRSFDALINSWHPDPTPSSIRQTWTSEGSRTNDGSNFGSYESPVFDAQVDSAVASHDAKQARTLYLRAYQTFVDDAPAIMLYEPNLVAGASKRIRLVNLRPDAWWAGIAQWSIPAGERIDRDRIGLRPAAR